MSPAIPWPKTSPVSFGKHFADERTQHHRLELGLRLAKLVRPARRLCETRARVGARSRAATAIALAAPAARSRLAAKSAAGGVRARKRVEPLGGEARARRISCAQHLKDDICARIEGHGRRECAREAKRPPLSLTSSLRLGGDRPLDDLGQLLALVQAPIAEGRGFDRQLGKLRPRPLRERAAARAFLLARQLIEPQLQRPDAARNQSGLSAIGELVRLQDLEHRLSDRHSIPPAGVRANEAASGRDRASALEAGRCGSARRDVFSLASRK